MKVFSMTDIGRVRKLNEDSNYTPAPGECFCAVADGMGGHNAGEVASAMAVEVFAKHMRQVHRVTAEALRHAVAKANEAVYNASLSSPEVSGMGTTFSALGMQGDIASIAHVGDSRIYLIRRKALIQMTIDHTLVEEMVMKGLITAREARVHPRRNIITRALGTEPTVEIDTLQVTMQRGDVFFLCSDGLTNQVEERDILRVTVSDDPWEEKLQKLVAAALASGGHDNITVMYAVYEEAGDQ